MSEATQFDNASRRKSFMGTLFQAGVDLKKHEILDNLDPRFSRLHNEGKIHIHNLEAYGQTYNCLMLNVLNSFPFDKFKDLSEPSKIYGIFNHFKDVISKLVNEQSGGIGFSNFDEETETLFHRLELTKNQANFRIIGESIELFIGWINQT